jgi:hypothetical protein
MGILKKHSRIYDRVLDHNESCQIGREQTRERWARLREQQEHNDAIQPIVQANTNNSFVPLSKIYLLLKKMNFYLCNFNVQILV